MRIMSWASCTCRWSLTALAWASLAAADCSLISFEKRACMSAAAVRACSTRCSTMCRRSIVALCAAFSLDNAFTPSNAEALEASAQPSAFSARSSNLPRQTFSAAASAAAACPAALTADSSSPRRLALRASWSCLSCRVTSSLNRCRYCSRRSSSPSDCCCSICSWSVTRATVSACWAAHCASMSAISSLRDSLMACPATITSRSLASSSSSA
mmetsp:Transcript_21972/g.60839  ORF Transcript_21972/g.60839 Transcript_21972/m.60839 type:complete len:213 (+) Transcript_21972:1559-2197(+)